MSFQEGALGAVFVHGILSSPAMWDPFAELIARDGELERAQVRVLRFGYATGAVQLHPLRVLPSLDTVADSLKEFLVTEAGGFERLVLIGHSQGGLVIQRCLVRMLAEGRGRELERIKRVVLLATPNTGSQLLLGLRRGLLQRNPQEKALRPFDEQLADTRRTLMRDIVHAATVTERSCPIPFSLYAGETDGVVSPASARDAFPDAATLPGDHTSIARPTSHTHRTYTTVKRLLLDAADHDPPATATTFGPATLEVHNAAAIGQNPDNVGPTPLTTYLIRNHDRELQKLLAAVLADGPSRLIVLTGESSTGKTRALYEALLTVAPERVLLRPTGAGELLALLEASKVKNGTVLWLNETQRFLYGPDGESAAARLRSVLERSSGVAALGTLWADPYWRELTTPGMAGDPHAQARALLTHPAVAARVQVPARLTLDELEAWQATADADRDPRLTHAFEAGADDGRVVQHLSGGPELLHAYLAGPGAHFTVREHALISAALDARRLGHHAPISAAVLAAAADGTLRPSEHAGDSEWARDDLRALTTGIRADGKTRTSIRGTLTALIELRTRAGAEPGYEPADYLDQHARRARRLIVPPKEFWDAAEHHVSAPAELLALAASARSRLRKRHAARLYRRAADAGASEARVSLAEILEEAGAMDESEQQYLRAADAGHTYVLLRLAEKRRQAGDDKAADRFWAQAAYDVLHYGTGKVVSARNREHWKPTEPAIKQPVNTLHSTRARLIESREHAGDQEQAEHVAHQAARDDDTSLLMYLAWMREEAGHYADAKRLIRLAADAGDTDALVRLAEIAEQAGDRDRAERLAYRATDGGNTEGLELLARMREPDDALQQIIKLGLEADGTPSTSVAEWT